MYNTPPCWAIYMCGLVFSHMLRNGGIEAMQKQNEEKAQILYQAIDGSDGFYSNPIAPANRSNMNVPFTIPVSQELEAVFIKEAAAAGLVCAACAWLVNTFCCYELHCLFLDHTIAVAWGLLYRQFCRSRLNAFKHHCNSIQRVKSYESWPNQLVHVVQLLVPELSVSYHLSIGHEWRGGR